MKELNLNEALCIINVGWKTEVEKELYDYAFKVVRKTAETKHLEYQLHKVNEKLEKLKQYYTQHQL